VTRASRLVLAVASVVVAILAAEGALRAGRALVGRPFAPSMPWLVRDPLLGQRNRPGFVDAERGVVIDALGFRGDDVAVPKPAGLRRIVCMGDSTTFGMWRQGMVDVRYDTSYPAELARRYAAVGARAEVVNAGVMGYTVVQALRLFALAVVPLAPDVVVIRLGNNDHALLGPMPWWLAGGAPPLGALLALPPLVVRSELGGLALTAWQRLRASPPPPPPVHKVPLDAFARDLRELVAAVRAAGADPVLLDFPYRPLGHGPWRGEALPNESTEATTLEELHAIHARYQAIVERVAAETHTPLVRTADALAREAAAAFTDFDNSHPTAAGYRVIAGVLQHDLVEGRVVVGAP
jgi:lysophospholipase L1-like esterase